LPNDKDLRSGAGDGVVIRMTPLRQAGKSG